MTHRRRVLKDIRFYSGSILLTQMVTVAASVLTRRFLGPTQMGVWAFLQTLLGYAEYSALGTTAAAALEIPLHNGRGDAERSRRITNAAFSFALISSLAVAAVSVAYALLRRAALREELFYGLLMAGVFVVLQRFNGLFITLVRADKQFTLAGKQMLYSSLVNAALIALLSYRFRIYGFLAAMALSLLFNIVYLMRRSGLRMSFVSDWAQMGSLVRYGLPLMSIGLMGTVFETMDRLFITRFLGFEMLGLYSVALMAVNYLNGVPNSVGVVTISHLQEKVGQAGEKAALTAYLKRVDAGYGALMLLLIASAWCLVPWMVRALLPEFVDGLPALKWLVLGTYFSALSQGYTQLLYVVRKHRAMLVLLPLASIAAVALNLSALAAGHGVVGVAAATAVSSFVYFTLLFFYGSAQAQPLPVSMVLYARAVGLFALLAAALVAADRFITAGGSAWNAPIKLAALSALILPAAWRLRRAL